MSDEYETDAAGAVGRMILVSIVSGCALLAIVAGVAAWWVGR